jgi:1-aminocyclopropane-1-carboxylate deaminase
LLFLPYHQTPIIELKSSQLAQFGLRLLIKCEFLNHLFVSGNKWWKLKYNLEEATQLQHTNLLTFGGAYSNHIYATAAAAKELGFKSIGIIRGEETLPLNKTLAFAGSCGMKLQYVSREEYRDKAEESFIQTLHDQFGDFYLTPEGGTNELAIKGMTEFGEALMNEVNFDYLCLPVGTGGTMAGIVRGINGRKKVAGFSALKGGGFLNEEVRNWTSNRFNNWSIIEDYHFGGYAKTTNELLNFMSDFEKLHQLPLDQVYTAKMMFGIFDLVQKGFFKRESTVLAIHTGGLQGRNLDSLNF